MERHYVCAKHDLETAWYHKICLSFIALWQHMRLYAMGCNTIQCNTPDRVSIASTMPQDVINFQVTHENYSYELLLFQVGHCRRPRAPGGCGGVRRWIVDGKEVSNLHWSSWVLCSIISRRFVHFFIPRCLCSLSSISTTQKRQWTSIDVSWALTLAVATVATSDPILWFLETLIFTRPLLPVSHQVIRGWCTSRWRLSLAIVSLFFASSI